MQNHNRKLKDRLQQNITDEISNCSPVWPWLIRYAGQSIHAFKTCKVDGRTARQRICADATLPEIPKFAERILFKPAKSATLTKDEPKWREGICSGFIDSTNDYLIGTPRGIMKCKAIRRFDETGQWKLNC